MNKKNNKGFTLIELLVVIAIIGILAALVLAAVGNARQKANDARVKANISQLRTIAESIYDTNGSKYQNGTVAAGTGVASCFTSPGTNCTSTSISTGVTNLRSDLTAAQGTLNLTVNADATKYCVESQLVSDTTKYFCADSTGKTVTGATACDATNIDC